MFRAVSSWLAVTKQMSRARLRTHSPRWRAAAAARALGRPQKGPSRFYHPCARRSARLRRCDASTGRACARPSRCRSPFSFSPSAGNELIPESIGVSPGSPLRLYPRLFLFLQLFHHACGRRANYWPLTPLVVGSCYFFPPLSALRFENERSGAGSVPRVSLIGSTKASSTITVRH